MKLLIMYYSLRFCYESEIWTCRIPGRRETITTRREQSDKCVDVERKSRNNRRGIV
jgi:hypothetical protein